MSDEARVVLISMPQEDANQMAHALVEKRLAACVNILPKIESIYRWEGKIETDSEALLIVKTSAARFGELRDFVFEHHHYELPEIIALPITEGLQPYLDYVVKET